MWARAGGPVGALISHSAALRLRGITTLSSACSHLIATGEAAGQQHIQKNCTADRALGLGSPRVSETPYLHAIFSCHPNTAPFYLRKA